MINSVSLCTVVYNEGHRIYEMLKAVEPHVDEMVIVDQRSTDNTVAEIERFASTTDKYVQVLFDKHWGFCEPSRGLAHKNSVGEWVLVLDADECISDEFAAEMRYLDEFAHPEVGPNFYRGCRLKRSLWIAGEHRWTGDYQYRYFHRGAVRYLNEIHTEPQPTTHPDRIYWKDYVGIWHRKSWQEQVRDELAYENVLKKEKGIAAERKRALNTTLALLREKGITPEQADAMTLEERIEAGISWK